MPVKNEDIEPCSCTSCVNAVIRRLLHPEWMRASFTNIVLLLCDKDFEVTTALSVSCFLHIDSYNQLLNVLTSDELLFSVCRFCFQICVAFIYKSLCVYH